MSSRMPSATVNGTPLGFEGVSGATNALDWLRSRGLTGAKEGCAEGECGACAVLVARPGPTDDATTEWTAVNACLVPAASLDGQEVVTVEGLGSPDDLHPVQHELAVRGGSQCGFCTPGFVCSLAAEFYRADRADAGCDAHALSGNLCRCTGYRPIQDAADALGMPSGDDPLGRRRDAPAPDAVPTRLVGATGTYARAADLADAFALLDEHPEAVLVAGSTDWGVEVNLRGARPPFVIAIDRVAELRMLDEDDDAVVIGAALTLSEIERRLDGRVPLLAELLPQFASRLIRNGATLGGNLATASPIGDAAPVLLALEAEVVLASSGGERTLPISEFFTGYRTTVRRSDELIRAVRIPLPLSPVTAFTKIAKRRFDDISGVAVAFALEVEDGAVTRARIGLGGVAATPIRAFATEQSLEGHAWSESTVHAAAEVLRGEGTPIDDLRASAAYRRAMLGSALLRLYADHAQPTTTEGARA
ncbi:MAG TPA: FAD binding domain-containing protein [Humibacillus xanthopallidus]|nr:FAD binding domain-containing protein [Humibacillus xanthopallidus]